MRALGTLTKWDSDRGFGFITPARGSGDLFVHISEFSRNGLRPQLNELLSFEVESGPNGKQRAVRVTRPGQRPEPAVRREPYRPWRPLRGRALPLLALAGLAVYGYSTFQPRNSAPSSLPSHLLDPPNSSSASYFCDGRTRCSQMTSCDEAMFFIRNCPSTQMDGDSDGVPCESQWC